MRSTMPTDLAPAFARKRAAQAKLQTEITMLLFWLITYDRGAIFFDAHLGPE